MWPTKSVVDNGRVGNRGFTLIPRTHPVNRNILRPHLGQDFSVSLGNNVRVLADGIVTKIKHQLNPKTKTGWGWYVEVQHENGYTTRYAHLDGSGMKFKKGDKVINGEIIALSGKSGGVSGPHLHLEVLLNGEPIDPMLIADLQELLDNLEISVNEKNPIELKQVTVTGQKPNNQKTLEESIQDLEWSTVRPDTYGNTGRYNQPARMTDQFYNDDFLKWYYKK
ncbi:MAG: M23 family metallopeptidase [Paludibacter sp.]|nr:M23 family metallopeptidase [Paludibacter sp.]MDD4426828.1 M23 family metallopeptidase [Paludibacter sp.]